MPYTNLLFDTQEGILTITINRPDKMNALNLQTMQEIRAAVQEAAGNVSVKGIIITGAGEKAFVAGADISELAHLSHAEAEKISREGQDIFSQIENSTKPVIAAVNGFALGGGCELAMSCHLRLASENAKFGQPEVNLGIIPGYGGTQRLTHLVGKAKALEFMITGELVPAGEALSLGLVNYVVKPEELLPKCREILQKCFAKGPLAIAKVIRAVNRGIEEPEKAYETEACLFGECFLTDDFKEGTAAFLEKRKPGFQGK